MMANLQQKELAGSLFPRSSASVFNRLADSAQIVGLVSLGLLSIMPPAAAHHAMDGRTPSNLWEGFLSGLAHPVIGLDHLAFVVAIGLLSIRPVRGALLPAFFLVAAMAGTGLHVAQVDLPATEVFIALSVVALGVILIVGKQLPFVMLAGIATIAGIFHGYAYGESIIGAEPTALIAYLVGFTVMQYAIAMLAFWLGKRVSDQAANPIPLLRYSGYAIAMIGVIFLTAAFQG